MPPAHSEKGDSSGASRARRIIRRGITLYLLVTVAVPLVCYFFGWRSLERFGAGFIYGGLVIAVFGLFVAAGNSLPLQLAGTRPAAGKSGLKRNDNRGKAGSAKRGLRFFLAALLAGVLLGATGLLLRLPG